MSAALCMMFPGGSWSASGTGTVPTDFRGTCEVSFLGTSTLHDFSGTGRCLPFDAVLGTGGSGKEVISSVEVDVPVAGMETRNASRDRQMREMFQSDRFPRIRGTARDLDVARIREETGKDVEGKANLEMRIRIGDVERSIRAAVRHLKEDGGRVTFDLEFAVSLKEFGLKAPSVFGIVRVGDKVSVKAAFTLNGSRSR